MNDSLFAWSIRFVNQLNFSFVLSLHTGVEKMYTDVAMKYVCCSCYLGLALALQKNGAGDRAKEAIVYLLAGMESMLQHDVSLALQHGEPQYVYCMLSVQSTGYVSFHPITDLEYKSPLNSCKQWQLFGSD